MENTYEDYDNEYYLMFEDMLNKQLEAIRINEALDNKGYPSAVNIGHILFDENSVNALKLYCKKRNIAAHEDTFIHDGKQWSEVRVRIADLDAVCLWCPNLPLRDSADS